VKTYCVILIIIGLAFPLVHATTTHMLQSGQTFEEELSFPGLQHPDDTEQMPEEITDSPGDAESDLLLVRFDPGFVATEKPILTIQA